MSRGPSAETFVLLQGLCGAPAFEELPTQVAQGAFLGIRCPNQEVRLGQMVEGAYVFRFRFWGFYQTASPRFDENA